MRIEKIVEEFNNVIFISDYFLLSDVYSELIIIKLFKFSISKRLSKKLYFLNLIIILRECVKVEVLKVKLEFIEKEI